MWIMWSPHTHTHTHTHTQPTHTHPTCTHPHIPHTHPAHTHTHTHTQPPRRRKIDKSLIGLPTDFHVSSQHRSYVCVFITCHVTALPCHVTVLACHVTLLTCHVISLTAYGTHWEQWLWYCRCEFNIIIDFTELFIIRLYCIAGIFRGYKLSRFSLIKYVPRILMYVAWPWTGSCPELS